ncbi:MAG: Crp/Fnr family transcriptional regulator [Bacillota bacterium]
MDIDLSVVSLFADLSPEQLTKISNIVSIKKFNKDEYIFIEGDVSEAFYLILKGQVKILKGSVDGKEKILEVMKREDFIGEMGAIENKPRSATAKTMTLVKLAVIERGNFLKLLQSYPEIGMKIIIELAKRLRRANKDIELLAFYDVQARLKELFMRLSDSTSSDETLKVGKMTHHEIANYIGTSRETITRTFNKLMDKDLLETKDNWIIIKNIDKW